MTHGALSIAIVDNGIGLHADLVPNLFDLYVQAKRTSDRQGGGLGLGLALVKNLVEAHDGTVTAESEGGTAAVFSRCRCRFRGRSACCPAELVSQPQAPTLASSGDGGSYGAARSSFKICANV